MPDHPIAAYLRVSSKMQAEANGTDHQRKAVERWLEYEGLPIDGVQWYQDEAQTGRTMNRPQFKAMTEAIERGEHHTVVCYDLSRLSRGFSAETLEWFATLDSLDVRLKVLTLDVDTSKWTGKMLFRMQLVMAAAFSDQMSDLWTEVHRDRRVRGLPTGGKLRWGPNAERDQFMVRLKANDPAMSLRDIRLEVGREFGKAPSLSTISRVLSRARDESSSDPEPAGKTG